MTVGSREDLFAQAKHIDDTERLIGRVLAGEWMNHHKLKILYLYIDINGNWV